ncbi:MAG: hypothetical protein ABR584_00050 [Candidatus Baltobacteraceae bacterium]
MDTMEKQAKEKKPGPLLERMGELNTEANALSDEIDEHLRVRAACTSAGPASSRELQDREELTG